MQDGEISPSGKDFQPRTRQASSLVEISTPRVRFPILHGHSWWIFIFLHMLFSSREQVSCCDRTVLHSHPSVGIRHLLNRSSNFHQISQEQSLGVTDKALDSMQNSGCHGNQTEIKEILSKKNQTWPLFWNNLPKLFIWIWSSNVVQVMWFH